MTANTDRLDAVFRCPGYRGTVDLHVLGDPVPLTVLARRGFEKLLHPCEEVPCLYVMSVDVAPLERGQGRFAVLLPVLESWCTARDLDLIFGSVVNERLAEYLKRKGYRTRGFERIIAPDYHLTCRKALIQGEGGSNA